MHSYRTREKVDFKNLILSKAERIKKIGKVEKIEGINKLVEISEDVSAIIVNKFHLSIIRNCQIIKIKFRLVLFINNMQCFRKFRNKRLGKGIQVARTKQKKRDYINITKDIILISDKNRLYGVTEIAVN